MGWLPIAKTSFTSSLGRRILHEASFDRRPYTIRGTARTGDLYFEKELESGRDGLPVVQWYPGHIAKSERLLREELKVLDVVIEVRDARIVRSTTHPAIEEWLKNRENKRHVLLLNRVDMISTKDKIAWERYYKYEDVKFHWTIGNASQVASGILNVKRELFDTSSRLNKILALRHRKPRPPRVCVIGFPNVGKSSIINRLLNQRACRTAPRAGVTRQLSWHRIGQGIKGLHALDSPGLIPTSMADQKAARKIAMCNSIGDAAYIDSIIAAQLLHTIKQLPDSIEILQKVKDRYALDPWNVTEEQFVLQLSEKLFHGDVEKAGVRILKDFRELKLGAFALELPRFADYA